jgi:ATP-dependent protease ClpP protease subunit
MPYANEHSARVRDPADFEQDSFRRKNISDGVDIITGKIKGGDDSMVTQTYRFDASKFTVAEAKAWLKDNNVDYISFEPASENKNMEAVLKIYGDIGEAEKMLEMFDIADDSISAKTVSDFLDENKDAEQITVRINSRGGDVQEGWAIHDLLINSGKKIKTIGEGKVYSIATIVFLSGTEREFMQNADGLIHNPFIPEYTLADKYEASDLEAIAESLRQEEAKILDFYVKKTGADEATLAEYMKEDTKLSAEDMLSLGFATKIVEPIMAFAYFKPKKIFKMDEKAFFEKLGSSLDGAIARMKNLSRISNQTLTDKEGNEFTLEKETGVPAVGDKATPDGTYVMESGKTITIAGGVITAIDEAAAAKTDLELANEKIAELEAKVTEYETAKAAAEAEVETANKKAEEAIAEAQGIVTELTNLKNTWKPDKRNKFDTPNKVGRIDINKVKELSETFKTK